MYDNLGISIYEHVTIDWTLALTNKPLFNEQFTAYIHSPHIMRLVHKYPVDTILPQHANFATNFDANTYHVLQQVWQTYGKYNELELENLILKDQAWQNARQGLKPLDRCNKLLNPATIKQQYLQQTK